MTARAHQCWYLAVSRCGVPPDCEPLAPNEVVQELEDAPFEPPTTLEQLSHTTGRGQGMTLALHALLRAGKRDALGLVVERCQSRIRRIIVQQLGRPLRCYLESGDVLQEVNGELLRSLDDYELEERGALVALLYSIVKHRIYNLDRTRRRRPVRSVTYEELERVVSRRGDGEEAAERARLIEKCLAELEAKRPRYARILRLRLTGWSYRKIAAELGCTEGAARVQASRARIELAGILERRQRPMAG